jgi:hypothetical protein
LWNPMNISNVTKWPITALWLLGREQQAEYYMSRIMSRYSHVETIKMDVQQHLRGELVGFNY